MFPGSDLQYADPAQPHTYADLAQPHTTAREQLNTKVLQIDRSRAVRGEKQ